MQGIFLWERKLDQAPQGWIPFSERILDHDFQIVSFPPYNILFRGDANYSLVPLRSCGSPFSPPPSQDTSSSGFLRAEAGSEREQDRRWGVVSLKGLPKGASHLKLTLSLRWGYSRIKQEILRLWNEHALLEMPWGKKAKEGKARCSRILPPIYPRTRATAPDSALRGTLLCGFIDQRAEKQNGCVARSFGMEELTAPVAPSVGGRQLRAESLTRSPFIGVAHF